MRLALTVLFVLSASAAAQTPAGMRGEFPLPPIVGMSGACDVGIRVGMGQVNAALHEWNDPAIGSFNLGTMGPDRVTVTMPAGAIGLLSAKQFDGQDAELRLRRIPQRTPERLVR